MRTRVRKIGVLSMAKIAAILYGVMGVFAGIVVAIISVFSSVFAPNDLPQFFSLLGIGAIVLFPIIYAILGFVIGAIAALIYNVVANIVGGVEIDLENL